MPLPTTTQEALQLAHDSLKAEHEIWKHEINLDALNILEERIRETAYGWWIPLGPGTRNTAWREDVWGTESFIVVTRDGSSNGLYLASKPQWWDDKPHKALSGFLRRFAGHRE